MATQLATRDDFSAIRNTLASRADEFRAALPSHITPEKFQRTVMTAVQQNPDLLNADRGSFVTACMKAAQDGLLPDGREAALVTFSTSKKDQQGKWSKHLLVQYMPMVYGLRKKILQSGEIQDIQTGVVYWQEIQSGHFIFEEGDNRMLRHKPLFDPSFDPQDADIAAAYSIATFKDGSKSYEVMRRSEINKVRQASQTGAVGRTVQFGSDKGKPIEPKGPWVDWFSEQCRKTVMRRHSKTLPMSGDIIDVEARDEVLAAQSSQALLASVTPDAPVMLPPSRDSFPAHNPETGEIIDDETTTAPDVEASATMAETSPGEGAASGEGASVDDPSDDEYAACDVILDGIAGAGSIVDLNSYWSGQKRIVANLHPTLVEKIEAARAGRIAAMKGKAK